MENILISFTADTDALDVISQKLGTIKQNMAGLVTGSGGTMTPTGKAPTATPGTTSAGTNDQAKATQVLIKANDDLLKKYDELSKKFKAFQDAVKTSSGTSTQSLNTLANAQKNVNAQITNPAPILSMRGQMRLLREEIGQLDQAGQVGSQKYNELVRQAGALDDAMKDTQAATRNAGSDTQALDAILAGTELAAGGFTMLTGASALFGVGSEDLAKTQARVQAAIALTVGLQQALNTVQKDGALIVGIAKVQSLAMSKAEAYRRLILLQGTSATVGATIAQRVFNAVAKANPYVLLAMALVTVVGALMAFNMGADKSAEKQAKLNELEILRIESLDAMATRYKESGAEREKSLNNELEVLKSSGASQQELAKAERELMAEKITNAAGLAGRLSPEIAALEENKRKVIDLENALRDLDEAKTAGKEGIVYDVGVQVKTAKVGEEGQKQIQDELDRLNLTVKIGADAKEGLDAVDQQIKVAAAKTKADALKNAQSESIAVASVKLIQAKKGSAEELAAKIGMIETQRRVDLDNTTFTLSEQRLKTIKAKKDIADANLAFNITGLEDEKALIEAKVSLSKKGSEDEFSNQKDLLSKQLEIELADIELSIEKKKALNDKYYSDLDQMTMNYFFKQSSDNIQNEISNINSQLATVTTGSTKELQLKRALIENKRALDVKAVQNSLESEITKVARIKEINSAGQKELNTLTYDTQTAALAKNSEAEILKVSDNYAKGLISKTEFEAQKLTIESNSLKRQIDIEVAAGNDGLAQKQEQADKEIALKQKTEEAKAQAVKAAFDTIGMLGNALMEGEKARLNQQMSDLDQYYTTDAEAAKKNKSLKLITEKEYNKKQLKIKQDIAKADKKQAVFNVIMSTIQAVAGTLAQKPVGIWNILLAALMGAQGAIQIAAIQSTPLPQYAKGKKGGSGEMAWVGEQGPEIMYVPNGASILPAHKSSKVRDAIGIMREYNIPVMPHVSKSAMEEAKANGSGIDYDLLASKVGVKVGAEIVNRFPKIPGQRPVSIKVDSSGTTVTDGDTTTRYRNRKYSGEI